MKLSPGARLYAARGGCEVIVVRAPSAEVAISCAGAPMLEDPPDDLDTYASDDSVEMGKRYTHRDVGLEVLCTQGGAGPLDVDGIPMERVESRPLPASD